MEYPTHEFTRPEVVSRLRRLTAYPARFGSPYSARLESFGSVIARSVIGGFELLIHADVLAKVPASKIRHLAHERQVYDQPCGFVSRLSVTLEEGEALVVLCRRDGYAIAAWPDGTEAPPILYLDDPVPDPDLDQSSPKRAGSVVGAKARRVAIVSGAFAAGMALVECGIKFRLPSVVAAGAVILVGAVVALVSLVLA
jgi:hypothetical protein